jgi:hypothetical protein
MSLVQSHSQLELPDSLQAQLHAFRRRVWAIKIAEAVCAAGFGILVAFLLMFAVDRIWETPNWVRVVLFVVAAVGCANLPRALYRWVWLNRQLEQLARLLTLKHPAIGDQLLGIIELVHSDSEQARSLTLCQAAVKQVAEDAHNRDFSDAVPNPRHRTWAWMAGVPAVVALGLFAAYPIAASNAWARFLMPWANAPRYTFTALDALPDQVVVPHGEPFSIGLGLKDSTVWKPAQGTIRLGEQAPVSAKLVEGRYEFELPSQIEPAWLTVHIGDARQHVRVVPTLRPELTGVSAQIALPEYLGRNEAIKKDVRGGVVTLVKGSQATFAATASRELASAKVDGQPRTPSGATVSSPTSKVEDSRRMEFRWQDKFGLAGKEPFNLAITGRDDEAPSLSCEDMPKQRVILDTETLSFKVRASDDFGIKRIGLEWLGIDNPVVAKPAKGEKVLAAGANDKDEMDVVGTFSAKSLGIEPQPVNVRVYAEDYFPGRPRVYSPTFTFYVLNAEQHAIWLTEQLSKWHRQSLEVRDKEMALHETNKQLRALTPEEIDQPETRRKIEAQSNAERANGRRLSGLVMSGEDLVKQATRNPEFGVGHLEKWAEMLQILKDISSNRMPNVADLLKDASQAPKVASNSPGQKRPMAGQVRDTRSGSAPDDKDKGAEKKQPVVPGIVDRESSQQPLDKDAKAEPPPPGGKGAPRLTLPMTTLAGKAGKPGDPPPPAAEVVDEAVKKQEDLLAEFEKIADELNKVLAQLEGSTLVKRLKAASRVQYGIAGKINDQLGTTFGVSTAAVGPKPVKVMVEMADQEAKSSHNVSTIMDDMESYFERRRFMQFKTVLEEMRSQDVVGSLRQLGDDLKKETGVSIAQCEFWSDTLDRWADDLVDPVSGGT